MRGYDLNTALEHSNIIGDDGYLLDSDCNRLYTEKGEETKIPRKFFKHFKIYCKDEGILDFNDFLDYKVVSHLAEYKQFGIEWTEKDILALRKFYEKKYHFQQGEEKTQ